MGARGVNRFAATFGTAAAIAVLVVGTLMPVLRASAHPLHLEPGRWYAVSPAQINRASAEAPVRYETAAVAMTTAVKMEDLSTGRGQASAASVLERVFPAGSAVWLVVSGGLLVLTASLLRNPVAGIGIYVRRSQKSGVASTEGSE